MKQKTNRRRNGFSLIEIMIVVVVMGILAALIVPQFSKAADKAKAARIVATADALKSACTRYYTDTGTLALEYGSDSYATATHHRLSMDQSTSGWNGPYLDDPMTKAENPFGTYAYLYATIHSSAGGGFDLTGSGTDTHTTGNSLLLNNVPEEAAEQVDAMIDGGGVGGGDWKTTGRVEWTSSGQLVILIFSP
ncbi:MAG: prepilin-type N-terminal cleavage/methylation domain-containing protein [Planctomycetota bacterium]